MGGKVKRALFWALAVSLVVHLLLLGSIGGVRFMPASELAFPIEANLHAPEPAPVDPAKPAPPVQPVEPVAPIKQFTQTLPEPEPLSSALPAPAAEPIARPVIPAVPPPAMPQAEPATTPSAPPSAPTETPTYPAVRSLADNLILRYDVQTGAGDNGFVAGRATYVWHSQKGRYSLVSTLEATGVAALFVSGRIIQSSKGVIDGAGLRPDQYWLQRNERKQDLARFDWDMNRLNLEGRGVVALSPQAQDLLSLPFHLAMTASEGDTDFQLGVTNGRKFNEFGFRVLGRERIKLKGNQLETLHLQGAKVGEGTLDVWLDLARSGLPACIRTVDRKGKVMELRLDGVEKAAGG